MGQVGVSGQNVIWIAVDGKVQGDQGISDALKPSSAGAVRTLQNLVLEVVMLTEIIGERLK